MYRVTPSLEHEEFVPIEEDPPKPHTVSPNSYLWPTFAGTAATDWTRQRLLARNGDPTRKEGVAIWIFTIDQSMPDRTAFSSLDGDLLIIPQAGTLDIQTELGKLLVRQNEIAVIPRGIRHRVTLPHGPARGWVCELYQGHYQLPQLGAIGSTGLANVRDFQIPQACFDGDLRDGVATCARASTDDDDGGWTVTSRLAGRSWACAQAGTPFDVVAWHGTNYPYKFDLGRFNAMGNLVFDEHDPSLFVVLTAPAYGKEPGTAVVDFAVAPPRYMVAEDTLWQPYYHRNTMAEVLGPIIHAQDPAHPLNHASQDNAFAPFGAMLNGPNTSHGPSEEDFQTASTQELKPTKVMNDGFSIILMETELPLMVSEWAEQAAVKNFGHKK
jgi:homogentisate 1,2-dioxygenase